MTTSSDTSKPSVKPKNRLTTRGQRTRASLIDAARAVFERDGFIDARVADIVNEAKVAHGTFYLYFTCKEDVFKAVIIAHQDTIEEATRAGRSGPQSATTYRAIEVANRTYIEGWAQHYRLMQAWIVAAGLHDDIGQLLDQQIAINIERNERALRRMQAADQISADLDPVYTACALSSMVMQFCIRTFRHGPGDVDIDKAVRAVTDIWARGIGLDADVAYRANSTVRAQPPGET